MASLSCVTITSAAHSEIAPPTALCTIAGVNYYDFNDLAGPATVYTSAPVQNANNIWIKCGNTVGGTVKIVLVCS